MFGSYPIVAWRPTLDLTVSYQLLTHMEFLFNVFIYFLYFQRLRESVKPVLKKHQLVPGHDIMNIRLEDEDYCDGTTSVPLQSMG